jgi:hypothetical protein
MTIEIHAPTVHVLLISVAIALLAIVCYFFLIPYLTPIAHWIVLIAYVVLALGTTVKA